jgi:putative ABC transport system permease protein
LAGLDVDVGRAAVAVPVAVGLAALAGLGPALRAARATPVDAVRPLVWAPRRVRPVRSLGGMALAGLRRTPGRAGLAAAALGIAVASASVLLTVQLEFRGQVVGTLLGDAVALTVRTPDLVALAAIGLLGAFAVADVLYLAVREQAVELAVLQGSGWSGAALSRLVLAQGLAIGVLGSLLGAAVGVVAMALFTGTWESGLAHLPAGFIALVGVVVAGLAAVVPALLVRRLPVARLVSEEA